MSLGRDTPGNFVPQVVFHLPALSTKQYIVKKKTEKNNDYTYTNKYVAQVCCLEHSSGKMLLRLFRLTASDPLARDWLLRNSLN